MTKKKEISIGTVKVGRNQTIGSYIKVKSAAMERFFKLENKLSYGSEQIEDCSHLNVGYDGIYRLRRIADIERYVGCTLGIEQSTNKILVNQAYGFLRAKGISEGITLKVNCPLTADQARTLGENIGRAMQALYVQYMRNHFFEIAVRANVTELNESDVTVTGGNNAIR